MLVRVVTSCRSECGVRVKGEIDTATRQFIHAFFLPNGAESLVAPPLTEVEGICLVTFAPDARDWSVECPICRTQISIEKPA
jgi:hypothetical protein